MTLPDAPDEPTQPSASMGEAGSDARWRTSSDDGSEPSPLDAAAAHWQVRRQDGLDADEAAALQAWLAQDPAHQAALDRLDDVWHRLGTLPADSVAQLRAGVAGAAAADAAVAAEPVARPVAAPPASAPPASAPPASRPAAPRRRAWLTGIGQWLPRLATAGIAAAVLGGGWLGWDHWRQQPVFSKTYATARGQQLAVQLPDGSALKLDTDTRAEVTLYRQRREVRLPHGQALFSVQAAAEQPFDVLAGPLRITVVGTRFSVRNTGAGLGSDGVSVVVEEGRVRVRRAADGAAIDFAEGVELGAGQSVAADAIGRLNPVTNQAPDDALAWREGRVNFERTPLAQALAEFERYGATRLVIKDPAVAAMRVNGSFDLRAFGAFVKALPQVLPVRLRYRDGVTEVVAAD